MQTPVAIMKHPPVPIQIHSLVTKNLRANIKSGQPNKKNPAHPNPWSKYILPNPIFNLTPEESPKKPLTFLIITKENPSINQSNKQKKNMNDTQSHTH